jgi:hypothetical protein
MFNRVLIAKRDDQPTAVGAAAQLHCTVATGYKSDFVAE